MIGIIIYYLTLLLIKGDDDQSAKLVESFSDATVCQLIDSSNCVALLLQAKRSAKRFEFYCTVLC